MSEITPPAPLKKPWTIKEAYLEDKQFTEQYQAEKSLKNPGEALHQLILLAKGKTPETQPVVSEETIKLTELNQSLLEENRALKERLQAEQEKTNGLQQTIVNLEETNRAQAGKIITMQSQVPTGTQFICTLGDQLATRMRKARQFVRRDGIATGSDYPSELAAHAITLFLKEEYPSIK